LNDLTLLFEQFRKELIAPLCLFILNGTVHVRRAAQRFIPYDGNGSLQDDKAKG
jgi:hypothetical protein